MNDFTSYLANLDNDTFDAEMENALHSETEEETIELYFAERSRRIEKAQAEIVAAEKAWEDEIDELVNPCKDHGAKHLVKLTKLTSNQMYRIEDEQALMEDLADDHFVTTKTTVETTRDVLEDLYSRISGYSVCDLDVCGGMTEAEQAMSARAALVSREALSAKLARALEWTDEARHHASEAKRISRVKVWDIADEA